MNIVDYIPFGQVNAISRKDLCKATGLDDRTAREAISKARRDVVILSAENGGYYQPTAEESREVAKWLKQETNRAKSIFWSMQGARRYMKNGRSQMD